MQQQQRQHYRSSSNNDGMARISPYVLEMQKADENIASYCPDCHCSSDFRPHFEQCEGVALAAAQEHYNIITDFHQENIVDKDEYNYNQQWYSLECVQCPSYAINKAGHILNCNTRRLVPGSVNIWPDQLNSLIAMARK